MFSLDQCTDAVRKQIESLLDTSMAAWKTTIRDVDGFLQVRRKYIQLKSGTGWSLPPYGDDTILLCHGYTLIQDYSTEHPNRIVHCASELSIDFDAKVLTISLYPKLFWKSNSQIRPECDVMQKLVQKTTFPIDIEVLPEPCFSGGYDSDGDFRPGYGDARSIYFTKKEALAEAKKFKEILDETISKLTEDM